jgi:small subunit ribosomal protein S21
MSGHSNVVVEIDGKGAERAIRKFKRMCEAYGVTKEYRARKEYRKPSIRKKEKLEAAQKRLAKNDRRTDGKSRRKI